MWATSREECAVFLQRRLVELLRAPSAHRTKATTLCVLCVLPVEPVVVQIVHGGQVVGQVCPGVGWWHEGAPAHTCALRTGHVHGVRSLPAPSLRAQHDVELDRLAVLQRLVELRHVRPRDVRLHSYSDSHSHQHRLIGCSAQSLFLFLSISSIPPSQFNQQNKLNLWFSCYL